MLIFTKRYEQQVSYKYQARTRLDYYAEERVAWQSLRASVKWSGWIYMYGIATSNYPKPSGHHGQAWCYYCSSKQTPVNWPNSLRIVGTQLGAVFSLYFGFSKNNMFCQEFLNQKFPLKNEVCSVAVCTKFLNKTMTISLDVLKELETNFKMRYARLKSEERPLNYSIFKKGHK